MAVVIGQAKATVEAAGGSRTFTASANASTSQNTSWTPGSNFLVVVDQTTIGTLPPEQPNSLKVEFYVDNTTTLIRSVTVNATLITQSFSFYMTSNGDSNGAARAGTVRMRIIAQRTDVGTYTADSDAAGNQGYVRSNTTYSDVVSDTGLGGADPTQPLGYSNSVFTRTTLGHPLFGTGTLTTRIQLSLPVTTYKHYTLDDGLIPADWTTVPTGTITQDVPVGSINSYRFPVTGNGSSSSVEFTFTANEATLLTYNYKVSSEATFDFLRVDVDGFQQKTYSGEVAWTNDTVAVGSGTHTIRFRYTKDSSNAVGSDTAWITNIKVATDTSNAPVRLAFNTSGTSVFDLTVRVDKRFDKALTAYTVNSLMANSGLTGTPVAVLSRSDTGTVFEADPRLRFVKLHQKNNNAFAATNPVSTHTGDQRLTSDLSFLATRIINVRGAGQNSLVFTSKLWDGRELISSEAAPVAALTNATSTNQGGEPGWSPSFVVWDEALPGGTWNFKHTFGSSSADYFGLEQDNLHAYSLVAADPNLRLIAGAGPTDDRRHFVPGAPFIVLVGVLNVSTGKRVALDTGTPKVALVRVLLNRSILQYLSLDGVWTDVTDAATVAYHSLDPLAGDANAFHKIFSATADWGASDIVVVGRAEVGGVPVSGSDKEINVQSVNNHDEYKFDGAGFVGFPTR